MQIAALFYWQWHDLDTRWYFYLPKKGKLIFVPFDLVESYKCRLSIPRLGQVLGLHGWEQMALGSPLPSKFWQGNWNQIWVIFNVESFCMFPAISWWCVHDFLVTFLDFCLHTESSKLARNLNIHLRILSRKIILLVS